MPRMSERAHALAGIDTAIETAVCNYLLASDEEDSEQENEIEQAGEEGDHLQDLITIQDVIASQRYLSRAGSAGKHDIDILEAIIHRYSETAFLALFRMHRASFWNLVDMLTQAGEGGYWDQLARQLARRIARWRARWGARRVARQAFWLLAP